MKKPLEVLLIAVTLLSFFACSKEVPMSRVQRVEVTGRSKDAVEVSVVVTYHYRTTGEVGEKENAEMKQREAVYLALSEMTFSEINQISPGSDNFLKAIERHSPNLFLQVSVLQKK